MLRSIKRRLFARRRRRERPIVTGDLELFGLSEIIQFLSMGKKTALVVLNRGHHQGNIWFLEGRATHAATDTAEGQAAFFETVCWNSGSFIIDYGVTSDRHTLHDDTMFLFMEGLRRIDESRNSLQQDPGEATLAEAEIDPSAQPAALPSEVMDVVEPETWVAGGFAEETQPAAAQEPLETRETYDGYMEAAEADLGGMPAESGYPAPHDASTEPGEVDQATYVEAEQALEDHGYPPHAEPYAEAAGSDELAAEMEAELDEAWNEGHLAADDAPSHPVAPLEPVVVSGDMQSDLIETIAENESETATVPLARNPQQTAASLPHEMASELDEAMAEVAELTELDEQLMELDAQGFVVVGTAPPLRGPQPSGTPAAEPPPPAPEPSADRGLPAEVLALHEALGEES